MLYICDLQEENDVNYEEEQEVADEFDSDFDEDVRASLYFFFLNNFTFFFFCNAKLSCT